MKKLIDISAYPVLSQRDAQSLESRVLVSEEAEWAAMQEAGRGIAEQLFADYQELGGMSKRSRVLLLLGKGHNGGDACISLRCLIEAGYEFELTVVSSHPLSALRPLALRAWDDLLVRQKNIRHCSIDDDFEEMLSSSYDLVIDGLLGLGYRPPLSERVVRLLQTINRLDVGTRVSVDIPTGLHDAGAHENSFRADLTYATGIVKRAMIHQEAQACVGRIRFVDLGFFDDRQCSSPSQTAYFLSDQNLRFLHAWRDAQMYKKSFGHVFLFAGSRPYAGALVMAAEAALRSGAGLVTAFCPASLHGHLVSKLPEIMWTPWAETPDGSLSLEDRYLLRKAQETATAMVVGPGLGDSPETFAVVKEIVETMPCPLVLDASALQAPLSAILQQRPRSFASVVLTPHLGELRQLGWKGEGYPSDEELASLARQWNAWLFCKGTQSRLTCGEEVFYHLHGHPVLARGGSGDVLAGLLGGRLAVHKKIDIVPLAEAIVWHGKAARTLAQKRGTEAVRITEIFSFLHPQMSQI